MDIREKHHIAWPDKKLSCRYEDTPPPSDELTSNVRVACFQGDLVAFPVTAQFGPVPMPGGTRERGEPLDLTLRRELLEELGAELDAFTPVGAIHFWSEMDGPYMDHLPHPEFYFLVGYAEVRLVQEPTCPEGAEQVIRVERLPLDEALAIFIGSDGDAPWWGEVLRHIAAVREHRRVTR